MTIITIIIHSRKSLSIEKKFGYWALLALFFFTSTESRYLANLLPLVAILFLDTEFVVSKKFVGQLVPGPDGPLQPGLAPRR